MEEVISSWQRDGELSWEILAEAVSQCKDRGGGKNVAQKIRESVGLGMYIRYVIIHWYLKVSLMHQHSLM